MFSALHITGLCIISSVVGFSSQLKENITTFLNSKFIYTSPKQSVWHSNIFAIFPLHTFMSCITCSNSTVAQPWKKCAILPWSTFPLKYFHSIPTSWMWNYHQPTKSLPLSASMVYYTEQFWPTSTYNPTTFILFISNPSTCLCSTSLGGQPWLSFRITFNLWQHAVILQTDSTHYPNRLFSCYVTSTFLCTCAIVIIISYPPNPSLSLILPSPSS